MIKYLLIGLQLSIGWYIGHEISEIIHRRIHSKCKNQIWYRKLYSQPTQIDYQQIDANHKVIYGFRAPEKTV